MEYTEGRLKLDKNDDTQVNSEFGAPIFETNWSEYSQGDARRLVACWNACQGLSTELLEKMAESAYEWCVNE